MSQEEDEGFYGCDWHCEVWVGAEEVIVSFDDAASMLDSCYIALRGADSYMD